MKKVYEFKTGTNNKHDSLSGLVTYSIGDSPTRAELEEFERDNKDDPKTVDDELNSLHKWANSVMNEKAKSLGKSEGETFDEHDDPVFFSGVNAKRLLRLAYDYKHREDYASAFSALLSAIPAMLDLQILEYQDPIVLGTKAANGPKDRVKDLTKNTFQSWIKDNEAMIEGLHTLPELMKLDQFKRTNTRVKEPTIRKWFNEVYPHHLRAGAPKK